MRARTRLTLLLAFSPCIGNTAAAQQGEAPARAPFSLFSLNVGGAAAFNSFDFDPSVLAGVQFSRLVPRTPGIDIGFHLLRWFNDGAENGGGMFDIGVVYPLPASGVVSIVPGVGLTTVGISDSDGGAASAGIYGGAHAVWRGKDVTLRGGLVVRGYGVFDGEWSTMVSATIGIGLVP